MSADGSWLIVRSDRLIISVATPGVRYLIGRSRHLPAAQQLTSKYVSNEHLCVMLSDDKSHLDVFQLGKNPTFCGTSCVRLKTVADSTSVATPSLRVTLTPAGQPDVEPCPPANVSEPMLASVTPTPVAASTAPPSRSHMSGTTLYFPEDLGLPTMAIRFEGGATHHVSSGTAEDASKAALSVPQMLSVPQPGAFLDTADDLDDAPARASEGADREKPVWQGLLDVALQQQRQQENLVAASTSHTAPAEAPSAQQQKRARSGDDAPHVEFPAATQQAAPTADGEAAVKASKVETVPGRHTTVPSTNPTPRTDTLAAAPSKPSPDCAGMGFWEWKCRADGKDSNPTSWRKYPLAIAQLLEKAYRAKETSVNLPDRLLLNKTDVDGNQCTYGVCFTEASVPHTMIQYQKNDPGRFRVVRRRGGVDVDRRGVTAEHILPSSTSDDSESDLSSDSDDSSVSSETDSDSDA